MASFFLIRLEFIEPFEKPYKKHENMTYTKPPDVSEVLATFFLIYVDKVLRGKIFLPSSTRWEQILLANKAVFYYKNSLHWSI